MKSKGEKEKYTHLNAEFQRIARTDKKAFLSAQCEEIEENNRMGKIRDLFKKIRDTKGTFHAKMGPTLTLTCASAAATRLSSMFMTVMARAMWCRLAPSAL